MKRYQITAKLLPILVGDKLAIIPAEQATAENCVLIINPNRWEDYPAYLIRLDNGIKLVAFELCQDRAEDLAKGWLGKKASSCLDLTNEINTDYSVSKLATKYAAVAALVMVSQEVPDTNNYFVREALDYALDVSDSEFEVGVLRSLRDYLTYSSLKGFSQLLLEHAERGCLSKPT